MKDAEYDQTELSKDEAFKLLYPVTISFFHDRIYGHDQDIEEMAADIMRGLLDDKRWNSLGTHTLRGLRAWVWKAVYYKAIDFIKSQHAKPLIASIEYAMEENPELEYKNFATPPPDVAGDEEYKRKIRAIQNLLSPKDYRLFDLRLKGHSPPEVAKQLGISEEAERTRYCRIRKRLQLAFKNGEI